MLTLAGLSAFVIADLTDLAGNEWRPGSVQQEITAIARTWRSVPVQPVLLRGQSEWSMFVDLQRGGQVLPPFIYDTSSQLIAALPDHVIGPAESKVAELKAELDRLVAEAARRLKAVPE